LVLAKSSAGVPRAVQLTKLRADGLGKRGDTVDRLTFGPLLGSSARLLPMQGDTLAVSEGVETALAFFQLRNVPTWATFGTANLAAFKPPPGVRRLIIAADGDAPGAEAAQTLFDRLKKQVRVIIAAAPDKLDWLDVLKEGGAACR
jgi:putative DNA primase/helicase